ncbi:hypothetical protein Tco_1337108 [Tanacetum coccineum]|uniref:Uncharacterized protein n=1 Tax=Tanacetum coccineum TaxID=301880 RepID=A0ABQ5BDT9_9ASTR
MTSFTSYAVTWRTPGELSEGVQRALLHGDDRRDEAWVHLKEEDDSDLEIHVSRDERRVGDRYRLSTLEEDQCGAVSDDRSDHYAYRVIVRHVSFLTGGDYDEFYRCVHRRVGYEVGIVGHFVVTIWLGETAIARMIGLTGDLFTQCVSEITDVNTQRDMRVAYEREVDYLRSQRQWDNIIEEEYSGVVSGLVMADHIVSSQGHISKRFFCGLMGAEVDHTASVIILRVHRTDMWSTRWRSDMTGRLIHRGTVDISDVREFHSNTRNLKGRNTLRAWIGQWEMRGRHMGDGGQVEVHEHTTCRSVRGVVVSWIWGGVGVATLGTRGWHVDKEHSSVECGIVGIRSDSSGCSVGGDSCGEFMRHDKRRTQGGSDQQHRSEHSEYLQFLCDLGVGWEWWEIERDRLDHGRIGRIVGRLRRVYRSLEKEDTAVEIEACCEDYGDEWEHSALLGRKEVDTIGIWGDMSECDRRAHTMAGALRVGVVGVSFSD